LLRQWAIRLLYGSDFLFDHLRGRCVAVRLLSLKFTHSETLQRDEGPHHLQPVLVGWNRSRSLRLARNALNLKLTDVPD